MPRDKSWENEAVGLPIDDNKEDYEILVARSAKPPMQAFLQKMDDRHHFRMSKFRRDLKWLKKQAVKHGLNPEDVIWLL